MWPCFAGYRPSEEIDSPHLHFLGNFVPASQRKSRNQSMGQKVRRVVYYCHDRFWSIQETSELHSDTVLPAVNLTYADAWPWEPGNLLEWGTIVLLAMLCSVKTLRLSPYEHLTCPYTFWWNHDNAFACCAGRGMFVWGGGAAMSYSDREADQTASRLRRKQHSHHMSSWHQLSLAAAAAAAVWKISPHGTRPQIEAEYWSAPREMAAFKRGETIYFIFLLWHRRWIQGTGYAFLIPFSHSHTWMLKRGSWPQEGLPSSGSVCGAWDVMLVGSDAVWALWNTSYRWYNLMPHWRDYTVCLSEMSLPLGCLCHRSALEMMEILE